MKTKGWDLVVLSEPAYEHLVCELYFDGQFLLVLDREDGRESIRTAFPTQNGSLGQRIPVEEFIDQLQKAVENLKR